jgi:hypothetical protein
MADKIPRSLGAHDADGQSLEIQKEGNDTMLRKKTVSKGTGDATTEQNAEQFREKQSEGIVRKRTLKALPTDAAKPETSKETEAKTSELLRRGKTVLKALATDPLKSDRKDEQENSLGFPQPIPSRRPSRDDRHKSSVSLSKEKLDSDRNYSRHDTRSNARKPSISVGFDSNPKLSASPNSSTFFDESSPKLSDFPSSSPKISGSGDSLTKAGQSPKSERMERFLEKKETFRKLAATEAIGRGRSNSDSNKLDDKREMVRRMQTRKAPFPSEELNRRKALVAALRNSPLYPKWLNLISTLSIASRLVTHYQKVSGNIQKMMEIPLKESGQLSFMMQMYKGGPDVQLSKRLVTMLDPHVVRNRETISNLDQLLKYRVRSFAMFSLEKRMKLCKIMRYETFGKVSSIDVGCLNLLGGPTSTVLLLHFVW